MSFIKQKRSWFFRTNAPLNTEGKKVNLEDGSRPNQDLFERLSASALFFDQDEDRAKLSTGGATKEEVGHVTINADADVLLYTNGLLPDRTAVPTAKNLTEVATSSTVDTIPLTNDVPAYADTIVEIDKDLSETKRNKFFPQIKATFITWLTANVLPRLIPTGGAEDYVLTKVSATSYDVAWEAAATVPSSVLHLETAVGMNTNYVFGTNGEDVLYIVADTLTGTTGQAYPTVTFPASPDDGDVITIKARTAGISGGSRAPVIGLLPNTVPSGMTLEEVATAEMGDRVSLTFRYDLSLNDWIVISDYNPSVTEFSFVFPAGANFVEYIPS